jgi:hypothetical protein
MGHWDTCSRGRQHHGSWAASRCDVLPTMWQQTGGGAGVASEASGPGHWAILTLHRRSASSAVADHPRRRQISNTARAMRGALVDTYIMSAVSEKLSTRARDTNACCVAGGHDPSLTHVAVNDAVVDHALERSQSLSSHWMFAGMQSTSFLVGNISTYASHEPG